MLKVKRKTYTFEEFAKVLNLGDSAYLLSIDILKQFALGSEEVRKYVSIEYVVSE